MWKKKWIAIAAAAGMLAALTAGGSLAYFTAKDTARNVITSGSIRIQLVEQTVDAGGAAVPFPVEGLSGIYPGATASKIVRVKNTGSGEAWIRVKVEPSILSAEGEPLPTVLEDGEPAVSCRVLEGWVCRDGCYYYEKPVPSGALTDKLLDEILFSPQMGNDYQGCAVNILISTQAVQTAHNGDSVLEAQGWPEFQ